MAEDPDAPGPGPHALPGDDTLVHVWRQTRILRRTTAESGLRVGWLDTAVLARASERMNDGDRIDLLECAHDAAWQTDWYDETIDGEQHQELFVVPIASSDGGANATIHAAADPRFRHHLESALVRSGFAHSMARVALAGETIDHTTLAALTPQESRRLLDAATR